MADSLIDKIKQKKNKVVESAPERTYQASSSGKVLSPESNSGACTRRRTSKVEKKPRSEDVVTTAKPKLLTLEESIHARVEQICFENPSISRDTLIEALLIVAERSGQLPQAIEVASERLTQRKRSAVRRRAKTMAENLK